MARSLIRKEQLNQTDMSQLIGEYGSGMFISQAGIESLLSTGVFNVTVTANLTGENVVYTTGIQTISSLKNFTIRPQVNGTGILLQGEATQVTLPENLVYTTGIQTISSLKNFTIRPEVNGTGILLQGEATQLTLPTDIVYTTGDQTISGVKSFAERVILKENNGVVFIGTGSNDVYGLYTLSKNGGGYLGPGGQTGLSIYAGGKERLRINNNGNIALDDFASMPRAADNKNYKIFHMATSEEWGAPVFSLASKALHTIFFGNNSGEFILGMEEKPNKGGWNLGRNFFGWRFKTNLVYTDPELFKNGKDVFFIDAIGGNLSGIGNFIDQNQSTSLDWNNRRLSGKWEAQDLSLNKNQVATQNSILNNKYYSYIGSFFTPNPGSPLGDRWYIGGSNDGQNWDLLDINVSGDHGVNVRDLRDPSITKLGNKWAIVFTQSAWQDWPPPGNWPLNTGFMGLLESEDLVNWRYRQIYVGHMFSQLGINDLTTLWAPEWYVEENGDAYVCFAVARTGWYYVPGNIGPKGQTPWIAKASDYNLTGWSSLSRMTGQAFPHVADVSPGGSTNPAIIDMSITKVSGSYWCTYNDYSIGRACLAQSTNLITGWNRITVSTTALLNTVPYNIVGFEGHCLRYINGKWRFWTFDASAQNSGLYGEGDTPTGLIFKGLIQSPPYRLDHGTIIPNPNSNGLVNQYDYQNISGLKNFDQVPTVKNIDIVTKADSVLYSDTNQVLQQQYYPYLASFFSNNSIKPYGLYIVGSKDAVNWNIISTRKFSGDGQINTDELRDPSIVKLDNKWVIAFTEDAFSSWPYPRPDNSGYFGLLQSTDLVNWKYQRVNLVNILRNNGLTDVTRLWAPEWFKESNGDLYLTFSVCRTGWQYSNFGGSDNAGHMPYIIKATDYNLTGWTGFRRLSGSAFPLLPSEKPGVGANASFIDVCIEKVSGIYYTPYSDGENIETRLAFSTGLFDGWTVLASGKTWYGTNFPYVGAPTNGTYKEGGVIRFYNGKWRFWIFDVYGANSGIYSEGLTPTGMSFVSLIKNNQGYRFDHGTVIQNGNYEGFINQYDNQTISGVKTFAEPITLTQNKGVGLYDRSNQFYGIYGLSSGANHPTAQVTGLSVYLGGQEKLRLYNNGHVAFDDLSFMPGAANNPMYKVIHFASNLQRSATIFSMASKALHTVFFGNNTGQFVLGIEGRPGSWPSLFPNGRQFGWLFKSNLGYVDQNIFEGGTTQFFIDAQNNGNLSGRGNFVDATNTVSLDWNNRRLSGSWNVDNFNNPVKIGRSSLNTDGGVLHLAGGISFPATQVSAADPNTLDDYEEYHANSIFNLVQDDSNGTYTLTQSGIYTKIGNVMYIQGKLQVSTASKVGTVGMRLAGANTTVFPNASNSSNAPENYIRFDHWASLANGVYSIYGIIPKGQNYIELYKVSALSTSSNGSRLTNQDINVGTQLGFQGFYFV